MTLGRRGQKRCAWSVLGWWLAWLLLGPGAQVAHAQRAEDWTLQWSAPLGCPGGGWARARVSHVRGQAASAGAAGAVSVEVWREDEDLFRVRVRAPDGEERELSAPTCDALAEAAVLVVALLMDGEPEAPQPPAPPRPRMPLALELGAAGVFDDGSLPGPTGGASAHVGLSLPWALVRAGFVYLAPRDATTSELPQARVRLRLLAARLQVCASPRIGAFSRGRLGPCAGFEAGATRGEERGLVEGDSDRAPWWAALGSLRGAFVWQEFWVFSASAGIGVPISRSTFHSGPKPAVEVYRSDAVVFRAEVGVAVRLRGRRNGRAVPRP